jgi:hypothetical protein
VNGAERYVLPSAHGAAHTNGWSLRLIPEQLQELVDSFASQPRASNNASDAIARCCNGADAVLMASTMVEAIISADAMRDSLA